MIDNYITGSVIKSLREKKKMTQEELAEQLYISHVHMNRIEKGKEGCSIDLLLELADCFGVSTDYLLTGRMISTGEVKEHLQEVLDNLTGILKKIES